MVAFPIHQLAFAFGILGNIVSFLVFLAPVPTFYRIFKKKSTEEFQSIPYSVALFSAMLMLYYAFVKTNALFLITINSIGCLIESIYLIIYMIYATKSAKIYTTKLLVLFNFGAFGLIVLVTCFIWEGPERVAIVGWICAIFSLCVFAAPLSIMRRVVKTRSVEYMPFSLSFFLTLCAVMWFFYGLLLKDFYIATPNVLGFAFGIVQMILYAIYRDGKKSVLPETKLKNMQNNSQQYKVDIQENIFHEPIKAQDKLANKGGLVHDIPSETNKNGEIELPSECKQNELSNCIEMFAVDVPAENIISPACKADEEVKDERVKKPTMKPNDSNV